MASFNVKYRTFEPDLASLNAKGLKTAEFCIFHFSSETAKVMEVDLEDEKLH